MRFVLSCVCTGALVTGKSEDDVTPFWRIVEPKSPLAKKLSCGPEFIQKLRAKEGL